MKKLCIFTKPHHLEKIVNFLNEETNLNYVITSDKQEIVNLVYSFDIGVSYCCPYKIRIDERPFYNYHPAPLPEYKGIAIYADAIKNKVKEWGVTLHRMTESIDEGEIIDEIRFKIQPPHSTNEIGTIAHFYLFELFKNTINQLTL